MTQEKETYPRCVICGGDTGGSLNLVITEWGKKHWEHFVNAGCIAWLKTKNEQLRAERDALQARLDVAESALRDLDKFSNMEIVALES
jgi:hypothetical protein